MMTYIAEISFSLSVLIWLLICCLLYMSNRFSAWLAGASISACLFFLGVTVAASFFIPVAFFLTPLWFGVVVLLMVHFRSARNEAVSRKSNESKPGWGAGPESNMNATPDQYLI